MISRKSKTEREITQRKCFDNIIENVGVNRAQVRIRPSDRAGDSGRDTFEKENVIKCNIYIYIYIYNKPSRV